MNINTKSRKQILKSVIISLIVVVLLSRPVAGTFAQNMGALALIQEGGGDEFYRAQAWLHHAQDWGYAKPSYWLLGVVDAWQGHTGSAVTKWHRAGIPTANYLAVVRSMLSRGKMREALALLEGIQRQVVLDPSEWVYVGSFFEGIGEYDEALRSYRRALSSEMEEETEIGDSDVYYRIGIILQRQLDPPKPDRALTAFRMAVAADDFHDEWAELGAYLELASLLLHKDPKGALEAAQFAVLLKPEHVIAHTTLGLALYDASGDLEMAEAELYKASLLDPGSVWPWMHLGQVYYGDGDYARSIDAYERALEINHQQFEAKQMIQYIKSLQTPRKED